MTLITYTRLELKGRCKAGYINVGVIYLNASFKSIVQDEISKGVNVDGEQRELRLKARVPKCLRIGELRRKQPRKGRTSGEVKQKVKMFF